jgi:hypothetical protein
MRVPYDLSSFLCNTLSIEVVPNFLVFLDNVISNVKHVSKPRMLKRLLAVEHATEIGYILPGRLRRIYDHDLILSIGRPDAHGKAQSIRWCRAFAPFPKTNRNAYVSIRMVIREGRIVNGVSIAIGVNEPS